MNTDISVGKQSVNIRWDKDDRIRYASPTRFGYCVGLRTAWYKYGPGHGLECASISPINSRQSDGRIWIEIPRAALERFSASILAAMPRLEAELLLEQAIKLFEEST